VDRGARSSSDSPWEIVFTPEAERWYKRLSARDADRIAAAIDKLQEVGPGLGRPHVDSVKGSRVHNMKELRSSGGHLRALFAFGPDRRAIVLMGGDKSNNWQGWYKLNVKFAERLYERHLREIGKAGTCPSHTSRAGGRFAESGR
jgi:hypothetical protein